jgi:hypothetical protein
MVIKRRKENGFLLFDQLFFAQHSAAIRQSKKRVTQKELQAKPITSTLSFGGGISSCVFFVVSFLQGKRG